MRQPRLMQSKRINKYEKCLLSEVVSNTLAYSSNLLHLGRKTRFNSSWFMFLTALASARKASPSDVPESFRIFISLQKTIRIRWRPNQVNKIGMACSAYRVLRAKMSKPDLCEPSNCRYESQAVSDAQPFFEERSLIQADLRFLSQNSCCSFWYNLGAYREYRSRASSIWLWIWVFVLNIISWLCDHVISRQNPHATWWCLQKNHDSSRVMRWCQPSHSAAYKKGSMACAYSIRFSRNPIVNIFGT
jgi:hypothetical protein